MSRVLRIVDLELTLKPLVVHSGETIQNLLDRFSSQPTMREIYTVDGNEALVGIINRKKIFQLVFGEHMEAPKRVSDFYHVVSATTAFDLCDTHYLSVKMDDTVPQTIRLMLEKDLFEIPVLDDQQRPVATLTLWDLLKSGNGRKELF